MAEYIDNDPMPLVSIALPTADPTKASGYWCYPPTIPPATLPEYADLIPFVTTITCEIDDGVLPVITLPVEKFSYGERGCYVTTPNALTVVIPADTDLSWPMEDRLNGDIVIKRRRTYGDGSEFIDTVISANFDDWTMLKSPERWEFTLSGSKTNTPTTAYAKAVKDVVSLSGDFDYYSQDKVMVLSGAEGGFISPADYVDFDGIGLYVDLITAQYNKAGSSFTLTQFGRL